MIPLCLCVVFGLTVLRLVIAPRCLRLEPGIPIVMSGAAPAAIGCAAADLQRDLAKVLGRESPLLLQRPRRGPYIEIEPPDPNLGAPEAHGMRIRTFFGKAPRVVLSGSDVRGTLYAIYSFSERVLEVPPLWFFADWTPPCRKAIDLPLDFAVWFPAPHVRWRGWFLNDTDMYAAWEARSPEGNLDLLLETMLRLKLNVLDLDEITDYPSTGSLLRARRVHRRGLALTTTHTSPLGTNWTLWETYWRGVRGVEPPALRLDQTKAMEEFWSHHITLCLREGFEMIWELGFRGYGDHGFANAFPDAPPEAADRAQVIGAMIRRQLALLRAHFGTAPLQMRAVLYNECSDYLAAGLLHLPIDPDLIWNYVAARRDHFPAADLRSVQLSPVQAYGYYLNLQFTSTGSHLAQAEGPWKIALNFEMVSAASRRPLDLWVVNVGNVREFLLEISAHASLAWSPRSWIPEVFLHQWCARHFGDASAASAATVFRAYYESYWTQRAPELCGFQRQYLFHDMRVARACEDLLDSWLDPLRTNELNDRGIGYYRIDPVIEGAQTQLEAVRRGLSRSVARLLLVVERASALEKGIASGGRRLWHDHLLVPAQVLLATDRALLALIHGYGERNDEELRRGCLLEADLAFAEARRWLSSADKAPFAEWSAPESLWGIVVMREKIACLLSGRPVILRERP